MKDFFVDPHKIAEDFGIIVIPQCGLGDLSGKIEKRENGDIVIEYDMTAHENRQRFTIAHEIGHYALGHLKDEACYRDDTKNYSLSNYDPKEAEANKYAAKLLMPKEKVDYAITEVQVKSVSELAKVFKVSEAAMRFRLQSLGWL